MWDPTNTLSLLQCLQNKRSLWGSKSKENSNNEWRKREYGELLQHVNDVTPKVTSLHFNHIQSRKYMAKAERLFLSRRIIKCLTKIKLMAHTLVNTSTYVLLGYFSLTFHHSCEHNSKDYVTKYVNKDSSTTFLLSFSLLCVNANTLPKFL